ncbi:MAG: small ribosomal subunit Rsm22 family protein, partial [bacterium]
EIIRRLAAALEDSLPHDRGRIAKAAKQLSLAFTSERAAMPLDYLSDPYALSAYLAAFLIPNAVKVMHCLGQIDTPGDDISVLDIGSGPGTASIAASVFFSMKQPDARIRIAAIDRIRPALEKAHELFKKIAPPHHSFESATLDITKQTLQKVLAKQRFDVIIAANVLNELSEDQAFKISTELARDFLKENGSFIIIDPALRETARPLMKLRDSLVDGGVARVTAPCLHQKQCPMLAANERDWCHFYINWEPPEFLIELDRLSGMDHTHLKMSYLIFKPANHESPVMSHGLWRVVSSPLVSKGKRELVLCGKSGELLKVVRLDKNTSQTNADFDAAKRGDVVSCSCEGRIDKTNSFEIIRNWG